jgi:5-methylcytosine-specific restriction protein A
MKPCSYPGCPNLTQERYCAEHKQAEARRYDQRRGSAAQRGYGRDWQRYRVSFLAEHPWCVECLKQGIHTVATIVDHVKPHKGDMVLFWDVNNHQSLCEHCHNVKTAKEDGGFGYTPRVEKV